jgi:hypothetical protein
MSQEPHLEPASRPGPITMGTIVVIVLGGLAIYYWSQIKVALNFG